MVESAFESIGETIGDVVGPVLDDGANGVSSPSETDGAASTDTDPPPAPFGAESFLMGAGFFSAISIVGVSALFALEENGPRGFWNAYGATGFLVGSILVLMLSFAAVKFSRTTFVVDSLMAVRTYLRNLAIRMLPPQS